MELEAKYLNLLEQLVLSFGSSQCELCLNQDKAVAGPESERLSKLLDNVKVRWVSLHVPSLRAQYALEVIFPAPKAPGVLPTLSKQEALLGLPCSTIVWRGMCVLTAKHSTDVVMAMQIVLDMKGRTPEQEAFAKKVIASGPVEDCSGNEPLKAALKELFQPEVCLPNHVFLICVQSEMYNAARETSWQQAVKGFNEETMNAFEEIALVHGVSLSTVMHQGRETFLYARRRKNRTESQSPQKSSKKKQKGKKKKVKSSSSSEDSEESDLEQTGSPVKKKAKTGKAAAADVRRQMTVTVPLRGGKSLTMRGISTGVRLIVYLFCQ